MMIQKNLAELKRKHSQLIAKAKTILKEQEEGETPWQGEDGHKAKESYEECMKHLDDVTDRIERCKSIIHREMGEAKEMDDEGEEAGDMEMSADDYGEDAEEMSRKYMRPTKSRFDYNSNRAPLIRGVGYKTAKDRAREKPGTRAVRFMIGNHVAKDQMSRQAGFRYVAEQLGDLEVAKALFTKDVSGTGNYVAATATGGALIPQDFSMEWLDVLWSKVVIRSSPGVQVLNAPFGNLTIPRTSTVNSSQWDAPPQEGVAINVSNGTFDDIQMSTKRLTSMVPVSNQLIFQSPLAVEQRVLKMMTDQMARAEDAAFLGFPLNGTSGVGGVPYGLKSLVATYATQNQLTFSGDYTNLHTVQNFLWSMVTTLAGQNVPLKGAIFYMSPYTKGYLASLTDNVGRPFYEDIQNQNEDGTLLGLTVKTSTEIPSDIGTYSYNGNTVVTTNIILAQPEEFLIADTMRLETATSSEATYLDNNYSNQVTSAYQKFQTVFRNIEFVDFNLAHPFAAVVGTAPFVPTFVANSALSNSAVIYNTQTALTGNSAAGSATYIP